MKLLIDMGAIKTGGGAQLALNFLDLLSKQTHLAQIVLLVPDKGPLAEYPFDLGKFTLYQYPSHYVKRLWFERTELYKAYAEHGITHIFTFFGAGLPHPTRIRSIVTTAYPTICYPESRFWQYAHWKVRIKNYINNKLRRQRLRQATQILVETPVMRARIARCLPFNSNQIFVVPPVPSHYLEAVNRKPNPQHTCFVLVSGLDPHKNLWRLPEIARALLNQGLINFTFRLTVTEQAFLAQSRVEHSLWPSVKAHFHFQGPVHPSAIQQVYEGADFLLNISDLESFSNNYMEAWKAGIPIIASDRDFAHGICGTSALYIEPHSPAEAAARITQCLSEPEAIQTMVQAGQQQLASLDSEQHRFNKVLSYIQYGRLQGDPFPS